MKTDPKARYQGYTFYFREGICWNLILHYEDGQLIKCRAKGKSINDVQSMSLYNQYENISNKLLVAVLNSKFMYDYLKIFVNNTCALQIGDIRQLPIVIPMQEQLQAFEAIFDRAYNLQVEKFTKGIDNTQKLESLQDELNAATLSLYSCNDL